MSHLLSLKCEIKRGDFQGSVGPSGLKPTGFFLRKSGADSEVTSYSTDNEIDPQMREKAKNFGMSDGQRKFVSDTLLKLALLQAEKHHLPTPPTVVDSLLEENQVSPADSFSL